VAEGRDGPVCHPRQAGTPPLPSGRSRYWHGCSFVCACVVQESQVGTSRDWSWPLLRFCQGSVGFTNSSIAFGPGAFLGEVDLLVDEDDLELNTSIVAFEDAEVPPAPYAMFPVPQWAVAQGEAEPVCSLGWRIGEHGRSRCAQTCARTRGVGYWFDTARAHDLTCRCT
jgi:hypothetical protein